MQQEKFILNSTVTPNTAIRTTIKLIANSIAINRVILPLAASAISFSPTISARSPITFDAENISNVKSIIGVPA